MSPRLPVRWPRSASRYGRGSVTRTNWATRILPTSSPRSRAALTSGSGWWRPISSSDDQCGAPVFEAYIRERLRANSIDLYAETHRLLDQILLALVLEHSGGI